MKKFISALICICVCISCAYADTIWVLCQPDSFVNIRPFANKKQDVSGRMECGMSAETNNKTKNGYLYLSEVGTEEGYGWIHKGYIVFSEPVIVTFQTNIYSKGRVACWRSIGGSRRCWVQEGDIITVYAVSEEWSVTNKGFIKTKYLGVNYDTILNSKLVEGQSNTEPAELYWEDD